MLASPRGQVPALVVVAFLLGMGPMWLLHRATRWNSERRIASLENAARASAMVAPVPPVAAEPLPEEPRTGLSPADEPKPTP